MKFSILPPPPPPSPPPGPCTWGPLFFFGGGGDGVKTWLDYCGHYAPIQPQAQGTFFLLSGPPNQWRALSPGSRRWPPLWGRTSEDLAIFRLACGG